MFKKDPNNKKKLKCKTKKQANDSFCDSIIYPEKDMVDILKQKENINEEIINEEIINEENINEENINEENINEENINEENINEENINEENINKENLNEENCFLEKRTDDIENKEIINSNKYINNEWDKNLLSPNKIYKKENNEINRKHVLENSKNIKVMDISENANSIYGQNNNNNNNVNYIEPIKNEKKEYEICNSNSSLLKSASDSNIDEQINKNNDNYIKELSTILNNKEIIAYLNLNNKKDIDEKTSYIFPSIDIDHKSYSYLEKGQDDYLIEMDRKIEKEIENFQNTFNHFYNLDNTNNKFHYNNNNINDNNNNNNDNDNNNNNNDNNFVENNNYINEQNKEEITKNLNNNNNNILNTNENNVPNNILFEKINDTYVVPKGQNKNNIFTYKLKRNIYGKIQKQKKFSHSTTKTRYYTLLNNLFNIKKKNILHDKKLQKHLKKKKNIYYIFPYNCGNTQIQLITGYIRCFKKYSLYKEFKKHEIWKNQKRNNEEGKKLNHINNMQNEFEISLLLCVNVSNCISPSEFLELFYPYDNFIFFLKVLNKKSNEEYMIYFLTFHIYVKQIMKKSRTLTFFNMKKKKNVKLYLVKNITMNRISCINKKKKKKNIIINTDTFSYHNGKKKINRIDDSSLAYYRMRTKLYEIQKKVFINPLYIISQNKFQLSCAVCLEPLYSENLSKIISYIFHNHFEKNKNFTGIKKKKKDGDNIITIEKDTNIPSSLKVKYVYGKRDTPNFKNKENQNDSLTFEKQYEDNKELFTNVSTGDIINKENTCKEELDYNKEFKNFNKKKYNYYLHVIRYISSIQNKYDNEIKNKWKKKQNNIDTIYENNKVYNNVCINILCGHIFHSNCLKKCCFTSCPICRYKQYNYQIANCDICEKNKNVKICLFCCFIGCSINYEEQNKIKEKKLKEKHKFVKKKLYLVKRILYIFIKIVYPFLQRRYKIYLHGKCNMIQQMEKKKKKYIKNMDIEMNDIRYNTHKTNINKVEQFPENQSIKEEDKNRNKNVNKNIYEQMNPRNNKHRYSMNNFYKYIYIRNIKDKTEQNFCVYKFKSNKIGILNKVHFNISSYKKKKKIKKINTCNIYSVVLNNSTDCTLSNEEKNQEKKNKNKNKNKNNKYIKCNRKNNIDHAIEHFYNTNHNYFYDISKNSVYDYSSQLYTKTIINFKKEDKENLNDMYSVNVTNHNDEKEIIDKKNIIMYIYEYNQLLCALLESQRNNFLESISDMKKNYENISKDNFNEANKIFKQLKTLQQKNQNLKNDIKKKISTLHEKNINNENLKKELQNLELINKKLSDDQKREINNYEMKAEEKKKIITEKQQIVRELKQQIADLNFHKQAVSKFSLSQETANSSFMIAEKITKNSRFKK
ncbi:conserved Plasmodium protein, unknown function [Plasmodium sp. gorilla clade G3]|nr:conserved Plasmodium protein, unknown function [Plasmodium sp. gorilla clade G3]